jgi:hypothetical protein
MSIDGRFANATLQNSAMNPLIAQREKPDLLKSK